MINDVNDKNIRDAILVKTLLEGTFEGGEGVATLTPKGFVGANIVAARLGLQILQPPITESDVKEIIKFLNDAETALDMLKDADEHN
jgi:hypothetical protein